MRGAAYHTIDKDILLGISFGRDYFSALEYPFRSSVSQLFNLKYVLYKEITTLITSPDMFITFAWPVAILHCYNMRISFSQVRRDYVDSQSNELTV